MVQHILQNREGLKVGIVVNDIAEANVDSEVLSFSDADGIVGLQNGCACCSGRDDLFARLEELINSSGVSKLDRPWDRLVVECSGVAEPESIATELEAMGKRCEPLMKRVFLAGIICLVDASTFWDSYNSSDAGSEDGTRLPLARLLLSQVEAADTIIINKADLATTAELSRLQELIKALSPNAKTFVTTRGAIPLRTLLPAEPIDIDMPAYVPTLNNRHSVAVRNAAISTAPSSMDTSSVEVTSGSHKEHGEGHSHEHSHAHGGHSEGSTEQGHAHGHSHDGTAVDCNICAKETSAARHARYGLTSFVYRSREGIFDPVRLTAVARGLPVVAADVGFDQHLEATATSLAPNALFEGVVRSKGFVRIKGSESSAYYWSHAGRRLEVSLAPGVPPCKGQELVFIGAGMDQSAITSALDECLSKL